MPSTITPVPAEPVQSSNTHRRPRQRRRHPRTDYQSPSEIRNGDHVQHTNRNRRRRQLQSVQDAPFAELQIGLLPSIPSPNEPPSADVSSTENPSSQGQQQTRGNRRGGRRFQPSGRQHADTSRTVQVRQFGGLLTDETLEYSQDSSEPLPPSLVASSSLNADAPEFRLEHSHIRKPPSKQSRRRRPSKSSAPDISTRIHEDIDNGNYECLICMNEVRRNSKIWSCDTCWSVFHMSCIKRWSTNESPTMAQQQPQNSNAQSPRKWRCPGCNLPKDTLPKAFTCWCKKELDPRSSPGLPPFSCGQTCSRPHIAPKKCPHPCPSICHAGPCPPCSQMGPSQICFCKKGTSTRRCVDTDYDNGWSCGKPCGELLSCGEHLCTLLCHENPCRACEALVESRCYCGLVKKSIVCYDRGDPIESKKTYINQNGETLQESWIGAFSCNNICRRKFDCGKHECQKPCHPQNENPSHCPMSPDAVSCCPCGKTELWELSIQLRKSCEDPIPNCSKPCHKELVCGHLCQQVCHLGECMPCLKTVDIACRCGRTISTSICHQGSEEAPQCMRVCRTTLNCGRHECGERCCSGEKRANERNKRKMRPLHSTLRSIDDGFEPEHICTRPCGRLLKCGNHTCHELCHKGPCSSCREAIFDEISCHCGRTILQPPQPCGTKPPPCRLSCERPKLCDHPQVPHNCHLDYEKCPKCPFLTQKLCLCGKNVLKNQPCWLADVRCGEICNKKLKCGAHRCRKPCHKSGECEDASKSCQQGCGKEKSCNHPCSDICHSPYPCKEDKPCQHKIFITCACQHLKQETKCCATKSTEGNTKKSLKCDEECARLERNRRLALALDIDPETHKDDHIPYSLDSLSMYQGNLTWAQAREKEFRTFAADQEQKRLRFKPMPTHQRAFLHALAEDFGFDSESMDPEPHRHIAIFKTPRFVMAPMKTLAECVRIRTNQRATAAAVSPQEIPKRPKASNTVGDPYNVFLVTKPRFGLTIEELHAAIRSVVESPSSLVEGFNIYFLPSEEIVLKPINPSHGNSGRALEGTLNSLKPHVSKTLSIHGMGIVQLCRVDSSLNIERRESDNGANDGWSQIAAKAAAPKRPPVSVPVGTQSSFTVLSMTESKRKEKGKKKECIVDDWELAEQMEEEKEKGTISSPSSDSGSNIAQ